MKTRLEEEVEGGQLIVMSPKTWVREKKRWFNRGGYSPYQLVFGVNPRVPLELLSDDQIVVPGIIADASVDSFVADGPFGRELVRCA